MAGTFASFGTETASNAPAASSTAIFRAESADARTPLSGINASLSELSAPLSRRNIPLGKLGVSVSRPGAPLGGFGGPPSGPRTLARGIEALLARFGTVSIVRCLGVTAALAVCAEAQQFTGVTSSIHVTGEARALGPAIDALVPARFDLVETPVGIFDDSGSWSGSWTTPNGVSPNASMNGSVRVFRVDATSLGMSASLRAGGDSMLAGAGSASAALSLEADATFGVTSPCVLKSLPVSPAALRGRSDDARSTPGGSASGAAGVLCRISAVGGSALDERSIAAPPLPAMIQSGRFYSAEATADLSPALAIRLVPGTTYRLRITGSAAGSGVSGGYAGTSVDADYILSLQPAACPTVTGEPLAQHACSGAVAATFSITHDGQGPFTYVWRREGVAITPASNPSASTPTLVIASPSAAHAGAYDCVVSNSCGSATSTAATLTVCPADTDDGTGTGACDGGVTIDDLLYYLEILEQGSVAADVDDGSGTGTPDGGVTIDDLIYYLVRFEGGC